MDGEDRHSALGIEAVPYAMRAGRRRRSISVPQIRFRSINAVREIAYARYGLLRRHNRPDGHILNLEELCAQVSLAGIGKYYH